MRLAFFSPPYAGHLNPMFALATSLRTRGHYIVFICIADIKPKVLAAGFEAAVVGYDSYRFGTLPRLE
jgi:zeaxanthin glucosyltransferase